MSQALHAHPQLFPRHGQVPADLHIPAPPQGRRLKLRLEPAWREAMRWSLLALTASWAAGEVTLLLLGL